MQHPVLDAQRLSPWEHQQILPLHHVFTHLTRQLPEDTLRPVPGNCSAEAFAHHDSEPGVGQLGCAGDKIE